jgi:Co/Zn/Cd efflux system component
MSACCGCSPSLPPGMDRRFRLILWAALAINLAMFAVEIVGSILAGSSALQADALDFLADAANYGISLSVAGLALAWRARAALIKGATMGVFGLGVLASTAWHAVNGTVPHAELMGAIGVAALIANGAVATMLFAYRTGDSNMRSIWLCSRNDVISNVTVLIAALGVFGTGAGWPDFVVALGMATLEITAAVQITRQAIGELRPPQGQVAPAE